MSRKSESCNFLIAVLLNHLVQTKAVALLIIFHMWGGGGNGHTPATGLCISGNMSYKETPLYAKDL